jgi:nicotinamidase-related amidase
MTHNTALVVIDVQLGMFDESAPVYQGNDLLARIGALIGRARAAGVPIFYIQHDGTEENDPLRPDKPGWAIHPAIQPAAEDTVIRKRHPDAFQETGLPAALEQAGITHLVLAGIQTEFCVDTTCRRAYSLGYRVTLVQDAHSTWNNAHLQAAQIIAHHNLTLGGWFAALKTADEIEFADRGSISG